MQIGIELGVLSFCHWSLELSVRPCLELCVLPRSCTSKNDDTMDIKSDFDASFFSKTKPEEFSTLLKRLQCFEQAVRENSANNSAKSIKRMRSSCRVMNWRMEMEKSTRTK